MKAHVHVEFTDAVQVEVVKVRRRRVLLRTTVGNEPSTQRWCKAREVFKYHTFFKQDID